MWAYLIGVMLTIGVVAINVEAAPLPDFSELIEKNSPAVVKITAVTKARQTRMTRQLPNNQQQDIPEIFRELLEQRQMPPQDRGSLGSGFFISSDGYVLTNNHVVGEADEIRVIMSDQREFDAKLVGTDERSDIALLNVEGKNLPQLTLAADEKLKVGQWVVAIGSPFGLGYSASAGIVSAIGRNIPSETRANTYVSFIQTDVAINPGNSGGPLFNMDGDVVGINSQIYSPSGGSVGLSFAIPSAVAIDVVAQLKAKGHVDRGWLGVVIQDVDKDLASSYGLDKAQGAVVADIDPKGPAAKANLRPGDLIIRFNGQDIHTSADLPHIVGRIVPGTKVPFEVIRKGQRETLSVVVGKLPVSEAQQQRNQQDENKAVKSDILGLTVAPADPAGEEIGVEVLTVAPDSAAQKAGLLRGDIITQVDFVDIDSVASYNKVVTTLPKNVPKAIRFLRGGNAMFRSVTIK
jgi:serine protease Do